MKFKSAHQRITIIFTFILSLYILFLKLCVQFNHNWMFSNSSSPSSSSFSIFKIPCFWRLLFYISFCGRLYSKPSSNEPDFSFILISPFRLFRFCSILFLIRLTPKSSESLTSLLFYMFRPLSSADSFELFPGGLTILSSWKSSSSLCLSCPFLGFWLMKLSLFFLLIYSYSSFCFSFSSRFPFPLVVFCWGWFLRL